MTEENKEIIAYKGFKQDWTCRGYQYEVGKTYEHKGNVKACDSGFHACEYSLDVLSYYNPAVSKFAVVKMSGETSKDSDDTKIASAKITIETEINLPEMVKKAVEWIKGKVDWDAAKVSNTGDQSAATNTGEQSVATNTGYQSVATNTGYQSAAANTGNRSAATNTGDWSAAEVSGKQSIAVALGWQSKAKASINGAIVCVYRNHDGELIHIKASKVGEDNIKADTWYTLDEIGEFVEVKDV
ncbi:DUF7666 domain-containing protein [Haemophilus influenzae]|uniref:DUF7666 domain-containing protein n=1 Tax=Haemophilus influenzae TaxID=727 RepID=UPI000D00321A|nr:hypothetical protein [Haemophilus influenzae]PRI47047.1 hypothetical protein BVZ70_00354 [Haemophilus influenzae]PRM42885.1 hypothetical protein BVZ69_00592 [Haemophilus influenzae]